MTALRSEEDGPRGFVPRSQLYAAQRRIEALEAELEASRDTLGRILGQDALLGIIKLGFTKCEAALIAAMLARPIQPTAAMIAAYQYDRSDLDADIDNLVKVRVCMIRKKARRYGCPGDPIRTLQGSGYALSDVGREWLAVELEKQTPASGHPGAIKGASK
jgi:DNA-binding response OmpR family regulator